MSLAELGAVRHRDFLGAQEAFIRSARERQSATVEEQLVRRVGDEALRSATHT